MDKKYVRLDHVIAIIIILLLGFLLWHRYFLIKQGFFPPAPPSVPADFDPLAENAIPLDSFEIPYDLLPADENGLVKLESHWFGFELKFPEKLIVQKVGLGRNELMIYFIDDKNTNSYQDEEELQVTMEVTRHSDAAGTPKSLPMKEWRLDVSDNGGIVYRGQSRKGDFVGSPMVATVFERDGFYYILDVSSVGDADARERVFSIVARDFKLIPAQMTTETSDQDITVDP